MLVCLALGAASMHPAVSTRLRFHSPSLGTLPASDLKVLSPVTLLVLVQARTRIGSQVPAAMAVLLHAHGHSFPLQDTPFRLGLSPSLPAGDKWQPVPNGSRFAVLRKTRPLGVAHINYQS